MNNTIHHHMKNKCPVKSKSLCNQTVGLRSVRLGVDPHLRLMTKSQTMSLPTAVTEDRGQACLSLVQRLDRI